MVHQQFAYFGTPINGATKFNLNRDNVSIIVFDVLNEDDNKDWIIDSSNLPSRLRRYGVITLNEIYDYVHSKTDVNRMMVYFEGAAEGAIYLFNKEKRTWTLHGVATGFAN